MNDLPKEGLRALMAQEGFALLDDPERVRALLQERFPEYPDEVDALARVLQEGVLDALAEESDPNRLARNLESRVGLPVEDILWAVQGWVDALPVDEQSGPVSVQGVPVEQAKQKPLSPEGEDPFPSWEAFFRAASPSPEPSRAERNLALLGLSGDRGRLFAGVTMRSSNAAPTADEGLPPLSRGVAALLQTPPVSPLLGSARRQGTLQETPEALERSNPRIPSQRAPESVIPPESSQEFPEEQLLASISSTAVSSQESLLMDPVPLEEVLFGDRPAAGSLSGAHRNEREAPLAVGQELPEPLEGTSPESGVRFGDEEESRVETPRQPENRSRQGEALLREGDVSGSRGVRRRMTLRGRRMVAFVAMALLIAGGGWFWWQHPQRLFDEGQELFHRKEYADAAAILRRGVARDPENAEALFLLAESYRAQGSADEALDAYRGVLQLTSGDALLFVGMGESYLASGRAADAVRSFEQALALVPNFTEARKGLGLAFLAQGDYGGARDALEKALAGRRDDLALLRTLAAVRRMLDDPAGAGTLYEEILALAPEDADAREGLAASVREAAALEKVRADRRAQEEVRGLVARGLALLAEGRPKEAAGAFEKAHALDPSSPEALEGLLEAVLILDGKAKAESLYAEALVAVSGDVTARNDLEQARAEAFFRYEQTLLFSGTPLTRAEALLGEGHAAGAVILFQEAVSADATDPRGWKGLGRALLSVGSADRALEAFQKADALVSGDGEVARGLRDAQSALVWQQRRMKADGLVRQGTEQALQGRHRGAMTLFRKALALVSSDADALRGMARSAVAQGLHRDGVAAYRKLLSVVSNDAEAIRELARLERLGEARRAPEIFSGDRSEALPLLPRPLPPLVGPVTPAREKLGALHARRGDAQADRKAYPEAAREYRRALELSPWQGIYRNNLGWAFARMGVGDAALAEFRQASLLDARQPVVQYNYGWALARWGDTPAAARSFAVGLRLSSDQGMDAYRWLDESVVRSGDVSDELSKDFRPYAEAVQEAAALRPEEAALYWNVAWVVYGAGRRSPEYAVSPDYLGKVLRGHALLAIDPERAARELQNLAGGGWLASTGATLQGHAMAREGRRQEAAEAYRWALELDPRNDEARFAWQNLGEGL